MDGAGEERAASPLRRDRRTDAAAPTTLQGGQGTWVVSPLRRNRRTDAAAPKIIDPSSGEERAALAVLRAVADGELEPRQCWQLLSSG